MEFVDQVSNRFDDYDVIVSHVMKSDVEETIDIVGDRSAGAGRWRIPPFLFGHFSQSSRFNNALG